MMIQSKRTTATPSQFASAITHLELRDEWRTVRIDTVRYITVVSGRSNRLYLVRADGNGCACTWSQTMTSPCSHRLAVDLAAMLDEMEQIAFDAEVERVLGPAPTTRYEALYPSCKGGCGDVAETRDGYCERCASDREWQARRDDQRVAVGV